MNWFIISTPLVRTSMFNRCTDFDTFYKESIACISDHRNKLFNANIFSFCSYIFALRKQIFTLGGCQPLCFRICSGLWTPKFYGRSEVRFKHHIQVTSQCKCSPKKHTGYLKPTLQYQAHPNKISTTNQFSIDHHSFPSPSSRGTSSSPSWSNKLKSSRASEVSNCCVAKYAWTWKVTPISL